MKEDKGLIVLVIVAVTALAVILLLVKGNDEMMISLIGVFILIVAAAFGVVVNGDR